MCSRKKVKNPYLLLEIFIIMLSFIIIIPLLIMFFGSFKNQVDAAKFTISLPTTWEWSNYKFVIESGNVFRAMKNSFLITGFSTVFGVCFSAMAAFIIARRGGRGAKKLYGFFLLGMIAPMQIITTYAVLKVLGLMGTFLGLILVYIGINLPFNIFLFTSFIKGIPREMDEAAVMDGCGLYRMFFRIILPLLRPVIATSVVIFAMNVWNDFQLPLYFLSTPRKWTMPLTVYNFYGRYFSSWNYVFADMALTALPILILYMIAQKHIISGMVSGAVKG